MKRIAIYFVLTILLITVASCNKESSFVGVENIQFSANYLDVLKNNYEVITKSFEYEGINGILYENRNSKSKVLLVKEASATTVKKINYNLSVYTNGDEVQCANTGTKCASVVIDGDPVWVIKK